MDIPGKTHQFFIELQTNLKNIKVLLVIVVWFLWYPAPAHATILPIQFSTVGKGIIVVNNLSSQLPIEQGETDGHVSVSVQQSKKPFLIAHQSYSLKSEAEFTYKNARYTIHIDTIIPSYLSQNDTLHTTLARSDIRPIQTARKQATEVNTSGWARVEKNGSQIAKMAPIHITALTSPPLQLVFLQIALPDGKNNPIPLGILWDSVHNQQNSNEPLGIFLRSDLLLLLKSIVLPLSFMAFLWWYHQEPFSKNTMI